MPTAIEFNHVSKQYRLGFVSTKTLSADLNRWWTMNIRGKEDPYLKIGSVNDRSTAADSDYVWALKDIDFKVEQGDVMGMIGKNGAGKSTLLKLLSKITSPTTGTIKARGRIGALLEVGTGFHPELTGRENIYMNGAILGMSKFDISNKLDEIIDFSGCERYIDTPVKRYSSGMMVRLGFAVAAHLDPEILVVDEVLAVGDAEFQKKAIGKMKDVSSGEGRTVLFVSHNMASIKALCKSCVLLENGGVKMIGNAYDIVDTYLEENSVYEEGFPIIDSFKILDPDLRIDKVYANGQENNYLSLKYPNRQIEIDILGHYSGRILMAFECLVSTKEGEVFAKMSKAAFSGDVLKLDNSDFHLHDVIQIPQNITDDEYYIELQLTYPSQRYLGKAEKALKVCTHSFFSPQGKTLLRNENGNAILIL